MQTAHANEPAAYDQQVVSKDTAPVDVAPHDSHASNANSIGINLAWEDLSFSIGDKKILSNMSGRLVAGRSCGLMGASGSGKTTLLNALSGRIGGRGLKGRISFNDVPYNRRYRQLIGYVPQNDIIGGMSTPRSAFNFAIRTRLGVDQETADTAVQKYIERLKLVDCRNTIVGIPGVIQGLSGGERKRTNIGMELIADTKLLLCDEPTSGLDSTTAQMVIKTLQDLAREENCTVMFSVHQPTADMLAHFDDLCLLCEGQVVYHGPMEKSVDYFESIGYICPENFTPTDFYMVLLQNEEIAPQLIAKWQEYLDLNEVTITPAASPSSTRNAALPTEEQTREREAAAVARRERAMEAYKSHADGDLHVQRAVTTEIAAGDELRFILGPEPPMNVIPYPISSNPEQTETGLFLHKHLKENKSDYYIQAYELFKRAFIFVYTDYGYLAMMLVSHLFFAVVVGVIFNNVEDSVVGMQDRMGLLFMCVTNVIFSHANLALNRFRASKLLYIREQQVNAYSPFLYFWATFIADIPIIAFSLMLETIIVYWAAGLTASAHGFFFFFAVLLCTSMAAFGLGCLVGAAIDNEVIAATTIPLLQIPMLMCAGLLADNDQIRPYWYWLEKISIPRYGAILLFRDQFDSMGAISCDVAKYGVNGCALQPKTGAEVMDFLGFGDEQDSSWAMWLSLCLFIFLMRFGQLIALYAISYSKS